MSIFGQEAHLAVVGDVAPDQVPPGGMPHASLGPESAGPKPLHGGVAEFVFREARVEDNDARVGIMHRMPGAPVLLLAVGVAGENRARSHSAKRQERAAIHGAGLRVDRREGVGMRPRRQSGFHGGNAATLPAGGDDAKQKLGGSEPAP